MTEPEHPAAAPAGNPTPEEIGARLEALLKRTHTLRAQRAAPGGSSGSPGMTWPPTDGELDGYDVVDVDRGPARPASADGSAAPPAVAARAVTGESSDRAASEFARPDWSELRLRTAGDEAGSRSRWLWVLTTVLALATVGQAAYIWYLQTVRPAPISGRLRVDGPAGAQVRVNGQAVGIAPLDHALQPGGYAIEIVQPHGVVKAEDVIVGLGRTVVLIVPDVTANGTQGAPGNLAAPGSRGPGPGAAVSGPASSSSRTGAAVSPTMGAVVIETVPPGLPVTMGGRPRGVTPLTIGMIRPGRHDVMVGRALRQVDITANEVTTLRVP